MRPSLAQRLFASRWTWISWHVLWTLGACVIALIATEVDFVALSDFATLGFTFLMLLLCGALGYVLSFFPGLMLLLPFVEVRSRLNGGPFKVGDTVQVICGRYAGRVGRVYTMWQGVSFRVDLGESAHLDYSDVLTATDVFRVPSDAHVSTDDTLLATS